MSRWIEKYRPGSFPDCVGNREIFLQLEGLVKAGETPHLLFYGPPGTGKTTSARIIARAILGEDLTNVTEINASSERGIDILRDTISKATRHLTLDGRPRIVILEEADGITREAQEMMRRPLESEGRVIFILCLNELGRMNMAILSRCATFHFKPVPAAEIERYLSLICEREAITLPAGTVHRIAGECGGDLRTAINNLQTAAAGNQQESEVDEVLKGYAEGVKA